MVVTDGHAAVYLDNVGPKKFKVMKEIRRVGLSLAATTDIVDHPGSLIGVFDYGTAGHLRDAIERAGGFPRVRVEAEDQSSASAAGDDLAASLATLVELHERGGLSDAEFAAAKARLLG